MADERPSWLDPAEAGKPKEVYLTTEMASTPWEAHASPWHRYLVWSGFAVALLVLAWAIWSIHALI